MTEQFATNAEKNLLGCALISREALENVLSEMQEDDFFFEKHRTYFRIIKSLHDEGNTVDVVNVADRLEQQTGDSDSIEYLSNIVRDTVSSAHVMEYIRLVKDKAVRRRLQNISKGIVESLEAGELTDSIVNRLNTDSLSLHPSTEKRVSPIAESVNRLIDYVESTAPLGVKSGYAEVDNFTGGFKQGELVLVAGRPSMGKTAFALSMAVQMARNGFKTLVFECEMSDRDLSMRMVSFLSNVPLSLIRGRRVHDQQTADRFLNGCNELSNMPMTIVDASGMTVSQVRARAIAEQMRNGVDVVIIDYLQLLQGELNGNKTTNDIVSDQTRRLKRMARELNIPVILLSQLNRAVDHRTEKRPILSDLRDSGAIEQDADIVSFLYRPWVYDDTCDETQAECIIAKNRNGMVGTANIRWDGAVAGYRDLVR